MITKILRDLVGFRSITPNDDGAIEYCKDFLDNLGFSCKILSSHGVNNLYAKLGNSEKNLCFAGHIDIVPPLGHWDTDPFKLEIIGDIAYGRGTNDMKGPLSACFGAVYDIVYSNSLPNNVSISFLLTSDEEIMGNYGTKVVIDYLKENNEKITSCILCESCSSKESGEYIKIGCRGSLNIDVSSKGEQCHVANAPFVGNHLHVFIEKLNKFCSLSLDNGTKNFDLSSIQLTSIDSGNNEVRNVISSNSRALLNVRYNDNWTHDTLESLALGIFSDCSVVFQRFGYPFIGSSPEFIGFLSRIIKESIGKYPDVGTSGGNSDAIFIKDITNVVEIGSPIAQAHIANEYIKIKDLEKLYRIYKNIILSFGSISI